MKKLILPFVLLFSALALHAGETEERAALNAIMPKFVSAWNTAVSDYNKGIGELDKLHHKESGFRGFGDGDASDRHDQLTGRFGAFTNIKTIKKFFVGKRTGTSRYSVFIESSRGAIFESSFKITNESEEWLILNSDLWRFSPQNDITTYESWDDVYNNLDLEAGN